MTTEQSLIAHYAAVRNRLRLNIAPKQTFRRAPPAPEPKPAPIKPVVLLHNPFAVDWMIVVNSIAIKHGIDAEHIMGRSLKKAYIPARQEAMYEVWRQTKLSFGQVGHIFKRDHTTIIWAIDRHKDRISGLTL